ncbi:MarR family winged helix-turn-helix transcriptional regulator [Cytobacillus sp. Hm23]
MLIEDSYGFLFAKIAQSMETSLTIFLDQHSLNARQYGILITLSEGNGMSQKELGEKLLIDRTTIVSLVDSLEKLQFVARKKDEKDRRFNKLVLTENGQHMLKLGEHHLRKTEDDILQPLTPEEKLQLKDILVKIFLMQRED